MLTAILPIRTKSNRFWSSARGLECVEDFLNICQRVSEIDRFIVITQDEAVRRLAEQHRMEVSRIPISGRIDRPYTFAETQSLARNFRSLCKNQTDALIIADHRNLLLSAGDIVKAHTVYRQTSEPGVISLSFCRDHPCQFKSFFMFLDCVFFHFDQPAIKDGIPGHPQTDLFRQVTCQPNGLGEITIGVSVNGLNCSISFHSQNLAIESYVAQILPFAENGPLYEQSLEIFVPASKYETQFDIEADKLKALIFILAVPSQSGEYDTVEVFTPPYAPWELRGSGTAVVYKKTQETMHSRQQFPPVYTYDGSLCILGAKHLPDKAKSAPIPLILKDSCIVTDWVDYWYTAISH